MSLDCALCLPAPFLWSDARCRVVLVADADYPAFCRVIWHEHVREMTDLDAADSAHLMGVVFTVERVLRELLKPMKMNLASFGNQIPHLHWHVIARFADDAHFPDPIWATRRRDGVPHAVDESLLQARLAAALSGRR